MAALQDFDLVLSKTGPNEYLAYVPDTSAGRAAERAFRLPTDTLQMREDLRRLEAYSLSSEVTRDDFHVRFGQLLYESALGGEIGTLFSTRLKELRKSDFGLRLRLRVDRNAPELMNLPWELLHDGEGFLVTRTETPISRLPLGIERRARSLLDHTLRMLVVVSSPLDLPGHMILNTEKEQEVIVAALDRLQCKRLVEIDFCEDATLATIQDYLSEQEYDILHFTGHGVFNEEEQRGELLLENDRGNRQAVSNVEFAALVGNHPSLRLVVLSACQSARTANNTAYADMASRLVMQGTSAVLAMQYSVLDETAILFANRFYTGVALNKPLDVALTESRQALQIASRENGRERIDFATPVLLLNDPDCVNVSQVKPRAGAFELEAPRDFTTVSVMDRGFVGRRRELRRIRNGFLRGRQRACIIHGLGGMGKSVLATRAATKLEKNFRGIKAVRMTATTRPEDILDDLNVFLNMAGVDSFNKVLHAQAPLAAKTALLAQILTQLPLLIIFDNFEDVLTAGRAVQAASPHAGDPEAKPDASGIADPELRGFFETLVNSVAKSTRFLFTTRYDFDPARGRLTAEIDHIALGELPFSVAVQCMNNHDVLAALPVVALRTPAAAGGSSAGGTSPITKQELYGRLGGHPYTIDVFARRASVTSVGDVWLEIEGTEQEMIEFTLLDRTFAQLPARAKTLLTRSSVLQQPPSLEALEWLMGGTQASAAVDNELKALLNWGMLSREETKDGVVYPMHALVRDYAHVQLTAAGEDETALLKRIAEFWDLQAKAATTQDYVVLCILRSRDYYYQAKEFRQAYLAVEAVRDHLMRWGYTDLLLKLTRDCIKTSTGLPKASAMRYLAILYQELGDLKTSLAIHEEVSAAYKAAGEVSKYTDQLHEIGMVHHSLGDFVKARLYYTESQALSKGLTNLTIQERYNQAMGVYQLALLDMDERKLESAETGLKDALERFREIQDPRGQALCLRELGQLNFVAKEYELAAKRVRESLRLNEKIGNKQGTGHCYSLLGKILLQQEKHDEAITAFEKAMTVFDAVGFRGPKADCIYYLGRIHRAQGNFPACIEKCLIAMSMFSEMGDHNGQKIAVYLGRIQAEMGKEAFGAVTARLGWDLQFVEGGEQTQLKFRRAGGAPNS